MKKYNLSEIMKRAWEIKKQDSKIFFTLPEDGLEGGKEMKRRFAHFKTNLEQWHSVITTSISG